MSCIHPSVLSLSSPPDYINFEKERCLFKKGDVHGDIELSWGGRIILVAFLIMCITKKYTLFRFGIQLSSVSRRYMYKAQNCFGTLWVIIKDWATSRRCLFCLFFYLAISFCCGGISTRTLMNNPLLKGKGTKDRIIVVLSIIRSENLNFGLKLNINHGVKCLKIFAV